jgi:hypothetical protein
VVTALKIESLFGLKMYCGCIEPDSDEAWRGVKDWFM